MTSANHTASAPFSFALALALGLSLTPALSGCAAVPSPPSLSPSPAETEATAAEAAPTGSEPAAASLPKFAAPTLHNFRPLPAPDPEFTREIERFVRETGLDEMTPSSANPDREDEWSSICVVDLFDSERPVVGGWKMDNFVYPASTYKLYVLGEAIRQILEGEYTLDEPVTIKAHNVRSGDRPKAEEETTVSEILRLMIQYSDNTAANEAIDLIDRRRGTALLHAMGLHGSEITRKFLTRSLEDEGYATVPGTTTNAHHFATFLWAAETGVIGGGQGRGLIKAYLATNVTAPDRIRAGLPPAATLYSKSGTWNIFTAEVGIVEDGPARYILCILTAMKSDQANPRIAEFTRKAHEFIKQRAADPARSDPRPAAVP